MNTQLSDFLGTERFDTDRHILQVLCALLRCHNHFFKAALLGVKAVTCCYEGNDKGRAYRDVEWEGRILEMCQKMGIGAQFGGKYFCHDVRVIRLPRHGASCPVGLGVSCSADRQALGKITRDGVFLEQLETDPGKYLPDVVEEHLEEVSLF